MLLMHHIRGITKRRYCRFGTPLLGNRIHTSPYGSPYVLGSVTGITKPNERRGTQADVMALTIRLNAQNPFSGTRIGNNEIEPVAVTMAARTRFFHP